MMIFLIISTVINNHITFGIEFINRYILCHLFHFISFIRAAGIYFLWSKPSQNLNGCCPDSSGTHNANHLIADFRPHQSIQRHIILGYILKLRPQFSQRSQQKHHCMFCYCIGRIERNIRCLQSIFFHGCKIKMIIAGRTGHYIFHSHFTDLLPEDISIILERREKKTFTAS